MFEPVQKQIEITENQKSNNSSRVIKVSANYSIQSLKISILALTLIARVTC